MKSALDRNFSAAVDQQVVRAGRYEVRFAVTEAELHGAQALRYQTLFVENDGQLNDDMRLLGREEDQWDPLAVHVIVVDQQHEEQPVVGTVRLLSSDALAEGQGFYTEDAYDIANLRAVYPRILELSRACIDSERRSGSILMLLWKFTMQYIISERFDLMLGCASFHGTDIEQHKTILSYLYQNNLAPPQLQSQPKSDNNVLISDLLESDVDWDDAKSAVPPLLRGYLKIGAKITDSAIIDSVFNTVFVGIYVDARDMAVSNHNLVRKA